MGKSIAWVWMPLYFLGDTATFIYLVFFEGYSYTWWNWIIAVPVDFFLACIWPIYWVVLR
jgi:hypothetical protein